MIRFQRQCCMKKKKRKKQLHKTYGIVPGFSGSSSGKESTCNAGDPGSISRWGRSPGGGIGWDRLPSPAFMGFPGGADICLQCGRPGFNPWVGRIPLEEGMATHSSILAWRLLMDRGAWRARVHGMTKSQTQMSD